MPMQTGGAIYYINTNDGYTKFETGEVSTYFVSYKQVLFGIMSESVMMLDSNDQTYNGIATHTNTKYRCVVNLNYF